MHVSWARMVQSVFQAEQCARRARRMQVCSFCVPGLIQRISRAQARRRRAGPPEPSGGSAATRAWHAECTPRPIHTGFPVMSSYPHHYAASASTLPEGVVSLESPGLPALSTAAPAQFGGPGDHWSPETLCVGAVANCFVLTFRSV